ncbi:MAG: ribosomal-processing cysteine protease Prp, partial [Lachnospiraceae bacterium]|nr:ribosomal-processing cysteine protease Prp [Lachnospiraceae bacterium]
TVSDEARLLLDSLVLGLKEIEKSYSRYLTIRFEEE